MSNLRNLAFALLASTPLLACSQPPAPPAPPAAPAPPNASHDAPKTVIGRHVEKAIIEARKELATSNISISDGFNININGHKVHGPEGQPKAEITPQGDLLIDGKAVGEALGAIFSGDEKGVESRMEAEGRKIEAEAMKLCAQLPPLLATQQRLSVSLPAFKPYATMTQDDINDCGKDGKHAGIAVTKP